METMLAGSLAGAVPLSHSVGKPVAAQDNHGPSLTDTRRITWTRRPIREDAPDTLQSFLRRSEADGSSVLVAFPPGWRTNQLVYYQSDEAVFVLEGDFGIGGHTLKTGQYCYLPDRMTRKDIYSVEGCVVIAFFSRISKHYAADPAQSPPNQGLEVVNPWRISWRAITTPERDASGTLLSKALRDAPSANDRTFLLNLTAGFSFRGRLTCTGWYEFFLLSGNLLVGDERCTPGAYVFTPAGVSLGPVCTETGALLLARFARDSRPDYSSLPGAEGLLDNYLAAAKYVTPPDMN